MNLTTVAARNVLRNRFRTVLTVLGGVVAITAFVLLRTVVSAWEVGVDAAAKDRLATRHKVSFGMPFPKRYIDVIRGVKGIKHATFVNWFGGKDPRFPNEFFPTLAVDPPSMLEVVDEIAISPEVKARWLEDRQGAIVGDVLAKKLGFKVGDKVTLRGSIFPGDWQFNIDGIYTAVRKSSLVDRSQFLFHWDYLNEALPQQRRDMVGWVISRVDDPSRGAEVSATIDRIFDEKDIQTITMSERAMNLGFMGMLSAVLTAIDIVSVIILAIMLMILGNTIAMNVRERTNEYGVLRALGFSPRHIGLFIVGEAVTIGALTGVLGMAAAYPFVELGMGRFLEENVGQFFPYFRIASRTAIAAFVFPIVLGVVASLLPAIRASRLTVTDALRRVA